jgi:hypothetical protein
MSLSAQILALDLLTLRDHTELAGDKLDAEPHLASINNNLQSSKIATVYRETRLVAYAMAQPLTEDCWIVTGFNTHPAHRSPPVLSELFQSLRVIASENSILQLKSHVYKTNLLSMAFHRRLGFKITNENAKAVEFTATVAELGARLVLRRAPKSNQHTANANDA